MGTSLTPLRLSRTYSVTGSLSFFPVLSELLSQLEIVGHLQQDFDTDTHLSGIFFYVTVVLLRLQTLHPEPPVGILA